MKIIEIKKIGEDGNLTETLPAKIRRAIGGKFATVFYESKMGSVKRNRDGECFDWFIDPQGLLMVIPSE